MPRAHALPGKARVVGAQGLRPRGSHTPHRGRGPAGPEPNRSRSSSAAHDRTYVCLRLCPCHLMCASVTWSAAQPGAPLRGTAPSANTRPLHTGTWDLWSYRCPHGARGSWGESGRGSLSKRGRSPSLPPPSEVEAAVAAPAERGPLPAGLPGRLRAPVGHRRGRPVERYRAPAPCAVELVAGRAGPRSGPAPEALEGSEPGRGTWWGVSSRLAGTGGDVRARPAWAPRSLSRG